jgi:uncharacterized protein (DUF924 family)
MSALDSNERVARAEELLAFWFRDANEGPVTTATANACAKLWFQRNPETDAAVRTGYADDLERAARGELDGWAAAGSRGRLALIVLLDQFTRNIHRGSARAFENDAKSLALAQEGLRLGIDEGFNAPQRHALYLPLMHSEKMELQRVSMERYRNLRDGTAPEMYAEIAFWCTMAERHCEIIERFGRYPHRNVTLGRTSTPEEIEFLKEPNSSF